MYENVQVRFGRSRIECLELPLQRRHAVAGGGAGGRLEMLLNNSAGTPDSHLPPPSCSIIHDSECEQESESVQGTLICLLEQAGGRSR